MKKLPTAFEKNTGLLEFVELAKKRSSGLA